MFFLDNIKAQETAERFGTPTYVYDEKILRMRCRDLIGSFKGCLKPSYSAKANSNLTLLKIIKEEGLYADAMSPGEIFTLQNAGFRADEIFYIGNNVSADEMLYAAKQGILVSVDSLSQLETFGKINRGGKVAMRFNPGLGAGHCDKVVTAGHETKFGIQAEFCPEAKEILAEYELEAVGINQHIGSLFLDPAPYVEAAGNLLQMVLTHFPGLKFVDFGGGFGIPYKSSEKRLDFALLRELLLPLLDKFTEKYDNKKIIFKCEPGRYVAAECGAVLGKVHSIKENYGNVYVGTDIGFNVLARPLIYDSYHEITVLHNQSSAEAYEGKVSVVGNICESGDILAKGRDIGKVKEGDLVVVSDAGAYGYSMASNYNCRLRPAEVLIREDGSLELIRERDSLESLLQNFPK